MAADAPFFIVGVPRSGTTLLRQMLRGHPRLAVPPESHFVPTALRAADGDAALREVLGNEHFAEWGLDPDAVRERVGATDGTPSAVVRATFETYAAAHNRPRWGDKTPAYLVHLPLLAQAFPAARFVHIVRDGCEVAVSWSETRWGPADLLLAAHKWRRMVTRARRDGARMPERYLEVQYRRLVANPDEELARILAFLGEDMAAGLADYQARSAVEMPGLPFEHRHLLQPPDRQVRDWRTSCTIAEQARVEAIVARTMRRVGLDGNEPAMWRRADAELRLLPLRVREWSAWVVKARKR